VRAGAASSGRTCRAPALVRAHAGDRVTANDPSGVVLNETELIHRGTGLHAPDLWLVADGWTCPRKVPTLARHA
jgi:hypothetical protein